MNIRRLTALGFVAVVLGCAAPAIADRTVMVILQEVPMTGTPPAGATGVNVEVKMDPAMMAAMSHHMDGGEMMLVCKPNGPTIMMCHGK